MFSRPDAFLSSWRLDSASSELFLSILVALGWLEAKWLSPYGLVHPGLLYVC